MNFRKGSGSTPSLICYELRTHNSFTSTKTVNGRDNTPFRKLFSISILLDTLSRDASALDSGIDTTQLSRPPPLDRTLPSTSILLSSMTQNGWCPHQVRLLSGRFTPTVIFYLASFPRQSSPQDHRNCVQMDHCVANNVDEKTYRCAHVLEPCGCEFLSAPSDQLKAIIRAGGVPLVSISRAASGEFILKVISTTDKTKYTAISHVWNDGLGNPDQNALPACQIKRLVQEVLNAEGETKKRADEKRRREKEERKEKEDEKKTEKEKRKDREKETNRKQKEKAKTTAKEKTETKPKNMKNDSPYFINIWMDTLCIPVDDEILKMKAIAFMTPIYKQIGRAHV